MLKIGLIDVDHSNFPNLALMKLSAFYKKYGNQVEWYNPFTHYNYVFLSKVFTFTEDWQEVIDADCIIRSGTGYAIKYIDGKEVYDKMGETQLCQEAEHIMPDYSLYPMYCQDTAYGFMSRGCPRACPFCHVAAKEGKKSVKVADLREFWSGQKNIVIMDPNLLACNEWKDILQQLIDSKAYIDFNQGIDARLLSEEKADMLVQCKIREIHFAWDRYRDKSYVLKGLQYYKDAVLRTGRKLDQNHSVVYTLVNFDTTIEQDLKRIYTIRDMGYWPYVMIYDKEHCDSEYKRLARWVNDRPIFNRVARYEDYVHGPVAKSNQLIQTTLKF